MKIAGQLKEKNIAEYLIYVAGRGYDPCQWL